MPTPPLPPAAARPRVLRVLTAVTLALALALAPLAAHDDATPLATPCRERPTYTPGTC